MSIQFTCEHCGKDVKAPDDAGGKRGKCPHCKQSNYIPDPNAAGEELAVAPLDDDDPSHELAQEAHNLERALYDDDVAPPPADHQRDRRAQQDSSEDNDSAVLRKSPEMIEQMIVEYLKAMSDGHLTQAENLAHQIVAMGTAAHEMLDRMMADEMPPAALNETPPAVLNKFYKQLRARF